MYSGLRFLDHPGEMAQRIRETDWSDHPLGPIEGWPQPLRFALNLCLGSGIPTAVYWGESLLLLYNDAWAPIPAERHPWALGRPAAEVWPDIWAVVGPQFEAVVRDGRGFTARNQMLPMERDGRAVESYWDYSFTPIRDEYGRVVGVLNQGNETTRTVLAERARSAELGRLRDLFQQSPAAVAVMRGPEHVFDLVNPAFVDLIGRNDAAGKPFAEALPELANHEIRTIFDQVWQSGEAHRAYAFPIELRRGAAGEAETHLLDFVCQPIKGVNAQVTDLFFEAHDISDRARAAQALRESEQRLKLVLEVSQGIGVWDWDIVADLVHVDRDFADSYGVDATDAGIPIERFVAGIHPDDRPKVEAAIAATLRDRVPFAEEYRVTGKDGSLRWVAARGQATFADDGTPQRFPGISFDITDLRAAEARARDSADRLRVATEAQAFMLALADRQRELDSARGVMRLTSVALGRRMGVDRVGFFRPSDDGGLEFGPGWTSGKLPLLKGTVAAGSLGDEVRQRYQAGSTVVVRDAHNEAAHADTPIARLSPAGLGVPLQRGGRWVASMYVSQAEPRDWSEEEIAFVEAIAEMSWDAVERVEATTALLESEQKFRAIANSIDQMVWSTQADGFHDYFNDRWYEYTGVAPGSTDGEGWNAIFHPDDQQRAIEVWEHSLKTGQPYHIEYRLRHHSGQYRWVLGRAQPVRDEAGRITRWFGTCTDIQEIVDARDVLARSREMLEQEIDERTRQLMAAEEQLRQAQKMEAVGQLTGGIAHDFNNMLAVVLGALDLLDRRVARGETDIARYVEAARDGATRAAALTRRLLDFSRQSTLAPRVVEVATMVDGMTDLLQRTLGEGIAVRTELAGDGWPIVADPSQLENSIINLAVNARDAMPDGGTLTIRSRNSVLDGDEAGRLGIRPGNYVELSVTDTGSGMDADVAEHAFEPFFTTKEVGKGTGLGLSQIFGFVRQSHGHVDIDSTPGQGTTVRMILPRASRIHSPPPTSVAGKGPGASGDLTVMVVEDERRVRNFSVEALNELGYRVIEAESPVEALAAVEAGASPDLLFTDIVMPGMMGSQLADKILERLPETRVLYTSGYTRDAVRRNGGVDDGIAILRKPFGVDELAFAVRAALADKHAKAVDASDNGE